VKNAPRLASRSRFGVLMGFAGSNSVVQLFMSSMAMGQHARRAAICFPVRIKCSANSGNSYRLGEQAIQWPCTIGKPLEACAHQLSL
jgi:hypothetical protein